MVKSVEAEELIESGNRAGLLIRTKRGPDGEVLAMSIFGITGKRNTWRSVESASELLREFLGGTDY